MNNETRKINQLIVSLFLQVFAVQVCFLYIPILYLMRDQSSLAFFFSSLQFVGPFLIGSVAGVVVDLIKEKRGLWKFLLVLVVMSVLVGLATVQSNIAVLIASLFGLSFVSYLSSNSRISVSRQIVSEANVSTYHRYVVVALESVGLVAPVAISAYLWLTDNSFALFVLIALSLSASAFFYRSAVAEVPDDETEVRWSASMLGSRIQDGVRFIYQDKVLWYSSLAASFSNLFALSVTLLALDRVMLLYPAMTNASPLILVAMGGGSIVGSLLQNKAETQGRHNLTMMQLGLLALFGLGFAIGMSSSFILIFIWLFFVGVVAAFLTVLIWSIRFHKSHAQNMGSIAGITGAIYKALPLAGLPLLGLAAQHLNNLTVFGLLSALMLLPIGFLFIAKRSTAIYLEASE